MRMVINFHGELCDISEYDGGYGVLILSCHNFIDNKIIPNTIKKYKNFNNLYYLLDDGPEGYPNIIRLEYTQLYEIMDLYHIPRKKALIGYNNSIKKGIVHYSNHNINTMYIPSFFFDDWDGWKSVTQEDKIATYDFSYFVHNGRLHKKEGFFKLKNLKYNTLFTYVNNRDFESELISDLPNDEFDKHLSPKYYYSAKINIIPESEYYSSINKNGYFDDMIHLSEKTFRCLFYGVPFILISSKNSLNTIKELGFKTYESLIDESYDSMDDDVRMDSAIKSAECLLKLYDSSELKSIVEYNKDLIYNDLYRRNVFLKFVIHPLKKYIVSTKNTGNDLI